MECLTWIFISSFTFTFSRSLSHVHYLTITFSLSLSHFHSNCVAVAMLLPCSCKILHTYFAAQEKELPLKFQKSSLLKYFARFCTDILPRRKRNCRWTNCAAVAILLPCCCQAVAMRLPCSCHAAEQQSECHFWAGLFSKWLAAVAVLMKEMNQRGIDFKSVLEVRFYFPACVLKSTEEAWRRFLSHCLGMPLWQAHGTFTLQFQIWSWDVITCYIFGHQMTPHARVAKLATWWHHSH